MSQWKIDASHSNVEFSVRHLVIAKVRGAFKKYSGTVELDDTAAGVPNLTRVDVQIDAASIDTREPKRDEHLRAQDFFDATNHPNLDFHSTQITRHGSHFAVSGELTIRGVTRPVVLEAEFLGRGKDPWGNERAAFSAKTRINREDFGLTWNQALEEGGVLVGTAIEIEVEVQAVRVQATEAKRVQSAAAAAAV
jgi:polyisoprenoid-binding protein YceI